MIRILLDKLYLFAGYAAGGFLIAIFVLMMLLSAGRPMGLNIPAGDDLVSWCMVATSFLGLAHTFRHGEMIRVGLLIDQLEGRARHVIEIASPKLAGARRFLPPSPLTTYQPACKPGSVWPTARTADVTAIPLARRFPGASSNLPE